MFQTSVLTSRKSSSTPSLSEVSESQTSVASTEQAASAENLTAAVKAVSPCTVCGSFIGWKIQHLEQLR